MFLQAPTGMGKSLIAESIRRLLGKKAVYLVHSKALQAQLADHHRGFPEAEVLFGRGNYPTQDFPERFTKRHKWDVPITCADCNKGIYHKCSRCPPGREDELGEISRCSMCHDGPSECLYEQAKQRALCADLAVLNYKYFTVETNGVGRFSNRPFVIMDEVDMLESVIVDEVELAISPRFQEEYNIAPPTRKTVQSAWEEWLRDEAAPKVELAILHARLAIGKDMSEATLKARRRLKTLQDLDEKITVATKELPLGGWIYDTRGDSGWISMRPIHVHQFGHEYLWQHGKQFLMMSATIISPDQMAADLGIDRSQAGFYDAPSSFPADRRPIRVAPVASMTNANKDWAWPKMAEAVRTILDKHHPDERVLIHTVSYSLAAHLMSELNNPRCMTYRDASERATVLEAYKQTEGAVLVAPSMERGISLDDELCRAVIVTKVPYLNLGDKVTQARLYEPGHRREGQEWYATDCIRTLVQMCGRGMRHENDHCIIWILDAQFPKLYRNYERFFPKWVREALRWQGSWRASLGLSS